MKSRLEHSLIRVAVGLGLSVLAGCSTLSSSKVPVNETQGAAVSGTVLAPLGNGLLGSAMAQLSGSDRRLALEAEYKALEYAPKGEAVTWKSRSGNVTGEVTAAQPYQVGSQNCRQYTHSYEINASPQTMRGTACRNNDGSWTPLS